MVKTEYVAVLLKQKLTEIQINVENLPDHPELEQIRELLQQMIKITDRTLAKREGEEDERNDIVRF